jgi:outer membrane protein assembly factor BamB
MVRLTLSLGFLILAATTALSGDWPEFRGPTGQGHSSETGLPLEWSETNNVLWKVPVPGLGWSSPVIADGKVWVTSATIDSDLASLRALAFDAETGELLVDAEVFRIPGSELLNPKNSHASPTPIVDGDRVYVHFGADGTAALSPTGELLWTARFPYVSQHGNGGSPALHGDLLILNCDGYDQAFVVALDTATGEVRWKADRRGRFSQAYSTPLVIRFGDRDQVVSVGAFRATAYDVETGDEIWHVRYADGFSNVPRPVYGNGLVYIDTGFNDPALLAVRVDGRGDVTGTHVEWIGRRSIPFTPSPLLVGAELYLVSDLGVVSCLDAATGRLHWQERVLGNYSASPVYADGRIYILSEDGVTTVFAPGTEYRELATNTLDGATLASMAVSDGAFFIRSHSHLYRISL